MKKISGTKQRFLIKVCIILTLILTYSYTCFSQNIDEILSDYYVANGSQKLSTIQSVILKGKLIQAGIQLPMTSYQLRPLNWRFEGTYAGITFIQAFNGQTGWTFNPFAGDTTAKLMSAEELKSMKITSDIDGMLWNWKEKEYQVEFIGKEEIEGVPCFVIKVLTSDKTQYLHYIDAETFYLIKVSGIVKTMGAEYLSDTFMSDYKSVEGIAFPMRIENKQSGQTVVIMNFDSVELNQEIQDSMFKMPGN